MPFLSRSEDDAAEAQTVAGLAVAFKDVTG
jgi:hypothetical protein